MSSPSQITDDNFALLHIERDAGVVFATIDAPPINVMTPALFRELAKFSAHVADDASVRVVVLRSDNPDFFIAHFDVEAILGFPTEGPAERPTELGGFHAMCERYRTMGKATIVEIGGRVGGGGSELSMSCDMRFGAIDRTFINQMEVPIGILPGGTGTQRLPRLVGRGRAMEVILGGVDLDARTAEQWGYLNRALPADELRPFVTELALPHCEVPATSSCAGQAGGQRRRRSAAARGIVHRAVPVPAAHAHARGSSGDGAVPGSRRADPRGRNAGGRPGCRDQY